MICSWQGLAPRTLVAWCTQSCLALGVGILGADVSDRCVSWWGVCHPLLASRTSSAWQPCCATCGAALLGGLHTSARVWRSEGRTGSSSMCCRQAEMPAETCIKRPFQRELQELQKSPSVAAFEAAVHVAQSTSAGPKLAGHRHSPVALHEHVHGRRKYMAQRSLQGRVQVAGCGNPLPYLSVCCHTSRAIVFIVCF